MHRSILVLYKWIHFTAYDSQRIHLQYKYVLLPWNAKGWLVNTEARLEQEKHRFATMLLTTVINGCYIQGEIHKEQSTCILLRCFPTDYLLVGRQKKDSCRTVEKSDNALTGRSKLPSPMRTNALSASSRHCLCRILAKNGSSESNDQRSSDKPKMRNILLKTRRGHCTLQNGKVIKDKEKLGKCSRLKETKEP